MQPQIAKKKKKNRNFQAITLFRNWIFTITLSFEFFLLHISQSCKRYGSETTPDRDARHIYEVHGTMKFPVWLCARCDGRKRVVCATFAWFWECQLWVIRVLANRLVWIVTPNIMTCIAVCIAKRIKWASTIGNGRYDCEEKQKKKEKRKRPLESEKEKKSELRKWEMATNAKSAWLNETSCSKKREWTNEWSLWSRAIETCTRKKLSTLWLFFSLFASLFALHFVYGFLSFQINVLMQSYTFLQAISSLLHMRVPSFFSSALFSSSAEEKMACILWNVIWWNGEKSFSTAFFPFSHHLHDHHHIIIIVKFLISVQNCRWTHFQVVQRLPFSVYLLLGPRLHETSRSFQTCDSTTKLPQIHVRWGDNKRTALKPQFNAHSYKLSNSVRWEKKNWIASLSSIHSNSKSNSFHQNFVCVATNVWCVWPPHCGKWIYPRHERVIEVIQQTCIWCHGPFSTANHHFQNNGIYRMILPALWHFGCWPKKWDGIRRQLFLA